MALLLCSLLAIPPAPRDLDLLVQAGREVWQVPGLAVVVVHKDRVVYLKGFGVKRLGDPGPVTPDTLFPLASCTKPFTSLAMAMLVDDGKLAWDDLVRKHIDYFHLKDRGADERVTLRDLLCHRTGVGRHDILWYRNPWSLEERIKKLVLLEPERDFRTAFAYQPVLYGAAGLAAANAAGLTWSELVESRVLRPLGMQHSFPTFPGEAGDLASPHRQDAGAVRVVTRYVFNAPDPAGSLHATARDLAAFLRLQLGDGTWQGRRLVSPQQLDEMHQMQMPIRRTGVARLLNPETVQLGYGLGWVVQDYRGRLMILHGGAIDGFRVQMTLVPQAELGIAILNNLDGTLCNLALTNLIVDRFLDVEPRDWNGYYLDAQKQEDAARVARRLERRVAQKPNSRPPLPLEAYAGQYGDAAYGVCRIVVRGGALHMSWGRLESPLEHVQAHRFLADEKPLEDAPFVFVTDRQQRVIQLQALERTLRANADS